MASSQQEAYMLERNTQKSRRLDFQHQFFTQLCGNQLLHKTTLQHLQKTNPLRIADVGCGTGAWLLDISQQPWSNHPSRELVGFDIADSGFPAPATWPKGVKFEVHDETKPFEERWKGYFDVVNVRLLSYAIKAEELERVVANVVEILRPGGYLKWRGGDATDCWTTPPSELASRRCGYIQEERIARGLTPAMVPPLIPALISLQAPTLIPQDHINPLQTGSNLLRVFHIEAWSTADSSSQLVAENKTAFFQKTGAIFLRLGAARRRQVAETCEAASEKASLLKQAEEMEQIAKDSATAKDVEMDCLMTWIVARKAWYTEKGVDWMGERFA